MAGDPGFLAALDELRALHLSKGHDYADSTDPLKNYVQSAKDGGVEPWRAAFMRLSEKYHRIVNLLSKGGTPNYESIDDTFMDLAAMSLIVRSLRAREPQPATTGVITTWPSSGGAVARPVVYVYPQSSPNQCSCAQGDGDTGEAHVGGEPV